MAHKDKYDYAAAVAELLCPDDRLERKAQRQLVADALVELISHMIEEHTSDYEHTSRDRY